MTGLKFLVKALLGELTGGTNGSRGAECGAGIRVLPNPPARCGHRCHEGIP